MTNAISPSATKMWGTAPGLLALLTESNPIFKEHALKLLHSIVEIEWPQIADYLDLIETIFTSPDTSPIISQQSSLLASKVYYHMGNLDGAVRFALGAGCAFNPSSSDRFTSTVVSHLIKQYVDSLSSSSPRTDLSFIVNSVLQNLFDSHLYSFCMCLAIETHFIDFVRQAIHSQPDLTTKGIDLALTTVSHRSYRQDLLQLFVELGRDSPDKFRLAQLYHALQNVDAVSELLIALHQSSLPDNILLAYQIAFDFAENASQRFRSGIINQLHPDFADLIQILTRTRLLDLYLQFLFRNNKTDIHVIVTLKETLESSKMLIHSSIITAYSFMYAGTGDDNFYRNNLQWFSNGKKWAQFMAIAGVGAIHIGHLKAALHVLSPFIGRNSPPYANGGSLYALGLIFANYRWDLKVIEIVKQAIQSRVSPVVKHGACLALGLITMGSHEHEYYQLLLHVLRESESMDKTPEAAEAAGYGIGMVMLGIGDSSEIYELLNLALINEHEKVIRGIGMGMALMMYRREDECEAFVIDCLLTSRVPLLRQSAAWVTALAYVGSASNVALQRLLHLAVSDVNPDVRRAAVTGIGFVLSRSPKEVPGMVDLLAKSYHPHVRAGAALALGIAAAGTGMPEAIAILEPLLNDLEEFVKQAAMIAMALVLQQQSDACVPFCKTFRAYLRKLIKRKGNEMEVFGLCVAYGVMNAGGRNVVVSCNSLRGENSALPTVGLALFCNYFYWNPLTLMLPLAFHPTTIIGLDRNLEQASWKILSRGSPALYANPPSFESETEIVKNTKVTLSISPEAPQEPTVEITTVEPEEDWSVLNNPSRVTLTQFPGIDLNYSESYRPVCEEIFHGIVMLREIEDDEDDNS